MLTENCENVSVDGSGSSWNFASPASVAALLKTSSSKNFLIVDVRSFAEFIAGHITDAVCVNISQPTGKRLKRNKLPARAWIRHFCRKSLEREFDVIVYDSLTFDCKTILTKSCLTRLLKEFAEYFRTVSVLKGGFSTFQAMYPSLCSNNNNSSVCADMTPTFDMLHHSILSHPHHVSLSQPCLPVSNLGPTKILPYLFLGSQSDAHCEETMAQNGITYVLNVSMSSPRPSFIQDGHFFRIPVNDGYADKLSPFFNEAFQFLDKVREANGSVLVHCLAGVSRSPTLAIAYIMHSLSMTMDEAYRYVKDKRPTISPNFNFLGQLLEYEKQLATKELRICDNFGEVLSKKQRTDNMPNMGLKTNGNCWQTGLNFVPSQANYVLTLTSPTTAMSRLNFTQLSPLREQPSPSSDELPKDISCTSILSSAPSSVVVRLGPKHCATKRPLSDPGIGSHIGNENGHEGTNTKRPLMRPSSINFSSAPIAGTRRKVASSWNAIQETTDGWKPFTLPSPVTEQKKSVCLQEVSPTSDGTRMKDEPELQLLKSQKHIESRNAERNVDAANQNHHLVREPVTIIQPSEAPKTTPRTVLPTNCTLTLETNLQNKPSITLSVPDSIKSHMDLTMLTTESSLTAVAATNMNRPDGMTPRPSELAVTADMELDCADLPQCAMARKSRSLENMLNCQNASDTMTSSEQDIVSDCKRRSSYLINVLASPVTMGLDKHILRCQTTKSDSFQNPSSTDSLEMIPVS